MNKYYEIKVTIKSSHPLTWRRFRVPADMKFNELAAVIEKAFNWSGDHLYKFVIPNTQYKKNVTIALTSKGFNLYDYRDEKGEEAKSLIVGKYFYCIKKLSFIYDFGDWWEHEIVIEKEGYDDITAPICLKAKSGPYKEDFDDIYTPRDRGEADLEKINQSIETYKKFSLVLNTK